MSSASELDSAEAELLGLKNSGKVPPMELLCKFLRLNRELKIRDSYPVSIYGSILLENYKGSLSEEELFVVCEQVAIAAMDAGATAFAASLIRIVAARFPESSRTRRLQGMYFEATGSTEKAVEIYTVALAEKPSDEMMSKRLVAVEKSRGQTLAAAEALRKYLNIYAGDKDAWEEMAEMYLQLSMFKQALFCYEELLLFSPTYPNYLVRYADVLYTLGGASNYRMARAYYAKAVEASQGRNVRALFGILSCYNNLTEKVSLQDSKTRAQIELPDHTAQLLIKLYKQYAPDKLVLLEPLLQRKEKRDADAS